MKPKPEKLFFKHSPECINEYAIAEGAEHRYTCLFSSVHTCDYNKEIALKLIDLWNNQGPTESNALVRELSAYYDRWKNKAELLPPGLLTLLKWANDLFPDS